MSIITKSTRKGARSNRTTHVNINASRNINAGRSITSGITRRNDSNAIIGSNALKLDSNRRAFLNQLTANTRRAGNAITAATNTTNIAARPDFLQMLPLFVQKLYILDVFGSVAMNSRQQIVPYFKAIAENAKGETEKGTVLSSPFANRQGRDPNFSGRVVKNEVLAEGGIPDSGVYCAYTPILPGSVTLTGTDASGESTLVTDNGEGGLVDAAGKELGYINYSNGEVVLTDTTAFTTLKSTYQYDNENVGPDESGKYGAAMGKTYLQLDEINLIAQAHQLASVWSVYSAFAATQEYGADVAEMSKEAAISELTAEINSTGFRKLLESASYKPQFNWDAGPVNTGSAVVPSDYLNMFKLKLQQASSEVYRATGLCRPNRLIGGTTFASYISMINGFQAESQEDTVGPYKHGKLDQFDIYIDPTFDPNVWVMSCKSDDIRRNSGLFGEYMPITALDPLTIPGDMSVQSGYATMYAMEIVNPATIVSGRLLGTF